MAIGELDELAKWGIAIATAHIDFGLIEFMVIVTRGGIDAKVLRIECLDDHMPGFLATPGPSRYLGEQRKCPFRGSEIRKHQGNIRRDNTHKRHAGKIESLGDHLCTHQYVSLPVGEAVEQLFVSA